MRARVRVRVRGRVRVGGRVAHHAHDLVGERRVGEEVSVARAGQYTVR